MMKDFAITLLVMMAGAVLPMLIYAATKAKAEFSLITFITTSRRKFFYGFIAMAIVAVLLTFVDGVAQAVVAVGFAPNGSAFGIGLTLGGLFVAGIRE